MKELENKRSEYEAKIQELGQWLIDNPFHPDRQKIIRDRNWYQSEVYLINRKIENLSVFKPELGTNEGMEISSPVMNNSIKNKLQ